MDLSMDHISQIEALCMPYKKRNWTWTHGVKRHHTLQHLDLISQICSSSETSHKRISVHVDNFLEFFTKWKHFLLSVSQSSSTVYNDDIAQCEIFWELKLFSAFSRTLYDTNTHTQKCLPVQTNFTCVCITFLWMVFFQVSAQTYLLVCHNFTILPSISYVVITSIFVSFITSDLHHVPKALVYICLAIVFVCQFISLCFFPALFQFNLNIILD